MVDTNKIEMRLTTIEGSMYNCVYMYCPVQTVQIFYQEQRVKDVPVQLYLQ
jgi:hypothetical protein